ncbi:hypothetical protein F5Y16DRAFT_397271 [Xylariaceae sp. FL0255]|nr:hypothetical protein F5Y16DRAFT_397271 [Xylariaceae sp. FL0255]
MAKDMLAVGPCHCETARKRVMRQTSSCHRADADPHKYRLEPEVVRVPWEQPPTTALPFQILADSESDSSPEPSDSDEDDQDGSALPDVDDDGLAIAATPGDDDDLAIAAAPHDVALANVVQAAPAPVFAQPQFFAADETDDSEDDFEEDAVANPADDTDDDDRIPTVSEWRLNLTVLSQRYNMYIVAYKRGVHIFRVRSCINHTLPARPDLILRPPASDIAKRVGGFIDPVTSHQVNHIYIGDLGEKETLILAYDDGASLLTSISDVVGYYTDHIENELLHLESGNTRQSHRTVIKPFFLENTGKSAWGVAVHKRSRLIAVGNNNKEVHVFYFAHQYKPQPTESGHGVIQGGNKLFIPVVKVYDGTTLRSEDLPSAFSDDLDGLAARVLAIDIEGKLWSIDVRPYRSSMFCVRSMYWAAWEARSMHRRNLSEDPPHGWGVLVLPESSFLPTETFRDSLGIPHDKAEFVHNEETGYYIGTQESIQFLANNSLEHPWVRSRQEHRFDILQIPRVPAFKWYKDTDIQKDWLAIGDGVAVDPLPEHNGCGIRLEDGSRVMRTYNLDIELYGGERDNVGIMLKDAILQRRPSNTRMPSVPFGPERLGNVLHIPELCLVVAGSLCGRVALVTLTRPKNPLRSFQRGFMVEAILPTDKDEDRLLRPICPLLGVAVGPIPSTNSNRQGIGERRYRIMLQYYDQRILSYELHRSASTNDLFIL